MGKFNQFRSIIQWKSPQEEELFFKFTEEGDEIKKASQLIVHPGQGCVLVYEGKIKSIIDEPGTYSLDAKNIPFITTITQFLKLYDESKYKIGIWFYKTANLLNIRWGTRSPIKYTDPVYQFPVGLRAFGNYSLRITDAKGFFTKIIAGAEGYTTYDLQEVLISRITQPITQYLATAQFSYAEIDHHINEIAKNVATDTKDIFLELGFELLDFRIEGTNFDETTQVRIDKIANVSADLYAAKLAGLEYSEMEKLKALRDAANNTTGGSGLIVGLGAGNMLNNLSEKTKEEESLEQKLKKLKQLFENDLITEKEYQDKKTELLKKM